MARALAAAGATPMILSTWGTGPSRRREEKEELARLEYKHALRRLAEAFPELEIPAGLHLRWGCTPVRWGTRRAGSLHNGHGSCTDHLPARPRLLPRYASGGGAGVHFEAQKM